MLDNKIKMKVKSKSVPISIFKNLKLAKLV